MPGKVAEPWNSPFQEIISSLETGVPDLARAVVRRTGI
jgi:hypothetical protein